MIKDGQVPTPDALMYKVVHLKLVHLGTLTLTMVPTDVPKILLLVVQLISCGDRVNTTTARIDMVERIGIFPQTHLGIHFPQFFKHYTTW